MRSFDFDYFPTDLSLKTLLRTHGLSSDSDCGNVHRGLPVREQDPCPEAGKQAHGFLHRGRSGDPWQTVTYLLRK